MDTFVKMLTRIGWHLNFLRTSTFGTDKCRFSLYVQVCMCIRLFYYKYQASSLSNKKMRLKFLLDKWNDFRTASWAFFSEYPDVTIEQTHQLLTIA